MRTKSTGSKQETASGWRCRWRVGRTEIQRTARTENQADLWLARVQDQRDKGRPIAEAVRLALGEPEQVAERVDFKALADRYLASLEGKRAPANVKAEKPRANALKDGLGRSDPATLDGAAVLRWAERMAAGRSPKTVNRYLALGSKVWQYGRRHGHVPEGRANPFRVPERAKEIAPGGVTFTRAELGALLARMPAEIADYALANAQTCWRPRESESLTWAQLEDSTLTAHASQDKSGRGKSVRLSPELLKALEARRGVPRALIFSQANGRPWSGHTRAKRFDKALAAAIKAEGIPAHKDGATWYSLKASGLTVLLAAGVSPAVVAQMSGVAIGTILKHYAGAMPGAQDAALAAAWGDASGDRKNAAQ